MTELQTLNHYDEKGLLRKVSFHNLPPGVPASQGDSHGASYIDATRQLGSILSDLALNLDLLDAYRSLGIELGGNDQCIFKKSSTNMDRDLNGIEESYLEAGCKYLCTGVIKPPYNCPDYLSIDGVVDMFNLRKQFDLINKGNL